MKDIKTVGGRSHPPLLVPVLSPSSPQATRTLEYRAARHLAMSDSDSDLSQASQELNEVVQPKVTDDLLKPPAPSYTSAFDLDGKSYRSVGVLCTPELALEAIKEFEAKTKIDRFASLPDNVVKQIIAWTLSVEVDKAEQSAKEADWTDCGRVRSTKLAAMSVSCLIP